MALKCPIAAELVEARKRNDWNVVRETAGQIGTSRFWSLVCPVSGLLRTGEAVRDWTLVERAIHMLEHRHAVRHVNPLIRRLEQEIEDHAAENQAEGD